MYNVGKLRIPTFDMLNEMPVIQKREKLIIRNLNFRKIKPKFFFISTDGLYVSDTYNLDFLNKYKVLRYDYDYCVNKRIEVLKEPDMFSNFKTVFSTFNKLIQYYSEIKNIADDPLNLNSNLNGFDSNSFKLFVPFTIDSKGYVSIDEADIRARLANIAIVPKNLEKSIRKISVNNITRFLSSFKEESNLDYMLVRKKKLICNTSLDYRLKNISVANLICIRVDFSNFNGNPNTIIIDF